MAGDNDWAINLRNVRKVYKGRVEALRGMEIRVRGGEIFGLLGPNGAGKSTLVKIMMTVVRPTTAEGTILGSPVGHKPTLARVGYLPENHRFPRYLSGRQVLEFFAALSNVDRATRKRRAGELIEIVGMTAAAERRIGTYSKGMMQRIGLAQALMNDPDLVLLDEPTDGVDPVGRRDIRQVLMAMRERGKTIFVNSHILSELELICDRVAILFMGQVAKQGSMNELVAGREHYEIELCGDMALQPAIWACIPQANGQLPGGVSVGMTGVTTVRIGTSEAAVVQPLIDRFRASGMAIRRVQPVRPSLEDLFMDAVQNTAAPGASPR
ncbi:MAG: ABC transporter ATP-binding protein [Tepidisphaeraceae bacterium]|jgi:ABC-2 type transport system ATP-binding protein